MLLVLLLVLLLLVVVVGVLGRHLSVVLGIRKRDQTPAEKLSHEHVPNLLHQHVVEPGAPGGLALAGVVGLVLESSFVRITVAILNH